VKKILFLLAITCSLNLGSATHRVALKPARYEATLRLLARQQMDIAGADWQAGTIEVVTDDAGLKALRALGVPLQVRDTLMENSAAPWLDPYTDPGEMEQFLFDLAAQHPDLLEIVPLTAPLPDGQTVYAARITHGDGPKPVFLLDAQHHAREVMTPEIALDAVEVLVTRYGTDAQVTRWVDGIEIWIVPSVNPDGAAFVFNQNYNWRKNRYRCSPGYGVDLNRNYPFSWDACHGSSGVCADPYQGETYRGASAGSEPETKGMIALMHAVKPVFYLTYHSFGQYILWPYGCDYSAEDDTYREIGEALNDILEDDNGVTGRYRIGTSFDVLYTTDGTSDDEPYARLGTFAYCIEVNSDRAGGFQPDYDKWRDATVQRQRTAWMFFLDQTLDGPLVRGTVRNTLTRRPAAGVVLTVEGLDFTTGESPRTTDSDGRYFFVGQRGMTYTLSFSSAGAAPVVRTVTLGEGPVDLDVDLAPLPASVAGPLVVLK